MRIVTWVSRYMAHDDPRTALANLVAILIVTNQPFYPLYVYAIAGNAAWVTVVTFISTPFFAAVPWLSRRSAIAGRMLMCLAGTLNTVMCVWAFGAASGVALFYLPCILLGVLLFRNSERAAMAFCALLPMLAFYFLRDRLGGPLQVFSADEYASLVTLHAVSVGSLTAFIGYKFSAILDEQK